MDENSATQQAMGIIIECGLEGMDRAFSLLFNEAMKTERAQVLKASAYERSPERIGYANGFKPKQVKSRLGRLDLQIRIHSQFEYGSTEWKSKWSKGTPAIVIPSESMCVKSNDNRSPGWWICGK